jgi:hypothetical protein
VLQDPTLRPSSAQVLQQLRTLERGGAYLDPASHARCLHRPPAAGARAHEGGPRTWMRRSLSKVTSALSRRFSF